MLIQTQILDKAEMGQRCESYKSFATRLDLYNKIAEGLRDVHDGRLRPAKDVIDRVRAGLRK